ncbi:MAG TPA: carbohydrate ABC transporter permease, partial [Luteimicrobium sp.]|nr:carbohydrate ABC transporter permease [Luteimicrobium sp.]
MVNVATTGPAAGVEVTAAAGRAARSKKRKSSQLDGDRGFVSEQDWRRPSVNATMKTLHVILLVLLVVVGVG